MASKKKVKQKKQKILNDLYLELLGIGLVVLAILMIGQLGLIGTFFKQLSLLVFGEFFWLIAIAMMIYGSRMIVKREVPTFFSSKQMGWYLVFISLIIFSHLPVYREFHTHSIPLLGGLWNYYWTNDLLNSSFTVGGGIVGAIIYGLLVPLITANGLYGLSLLLLCYGTLLICDMTFKDLYDGFKEYQSKQQKQATMKRKPVKAKKQRHHEVEEEELEHHEAVVTILNETVEEDETELEELEVDEMTEPEEDFEIKEFDKQPYVEPNEPVFEEEISVFNDFDYVLPPLDLLVDYQQSNNSQRLLVSAKSQARKLEDTFKNFDVKAKVQEVHIGPSVTRFEILPNVGVKVSKILNLTDDIALALAAKGIRIEAPIPGKSAIGIEVPNPKQTLVTFKEIVKEVPQKQQKEKLLMVLGRDISGKTVYSPLNKMPHLLVAGATGSGKSVCINTIICSILMRSTPNEVKMLMIDPKKVELNGYNGIPHLLAPVVTDPRLASLALKKVVSEMEYRYELFSQSGTRNIEGYNEYVKQYNETQETPKPFLPFIVVIIDELADLMMVASKEVEECIMRLTQMARAAGIHLIIATQRPSVDVITGVIKANIPSRIAFGVSSAVDSRTIIDMPGAEKLLGKGDMLFLPMGASNPTRVQGAFISDEEVVRIVEFIKSQVEHEEIKQDFLENIEQAQNESQAMDDPLMKEVLGYIVETKKVSASLLQRRFRIGYNRAARIVDDLEASGLIGPSEGSKPREVLMTESQYHELISNL
ncbi:DNA translocase FtsK [Turicibacter sp. TJ11]|uniref:DNA translocase FtsK n=1 Tax=Turicibacter sp. TJ11 TaxID=2806443 RepID=UPI001F3CABBA|nr:DNA translocase FtsK [Turicibacter sp. TJ11]